MWCFDVDARCEISASVTTASMKHATLRAPRAFEGAARDGGFEFKRVDEPRALEAPGKDFILSFGTSASGSREKTSREMKVSDVKAIYGKFVREGKLTVEGKDGTRVMVRGAPEECARVMRTLTTLK